MSIDGVLVHNVSLVSFSIVLVVPNRAVELEIHILYSPISPLYSTNHRRMTSWMDSNRDRET
jgi:hypothetical protein